MLSKLKSIPGSVWICSAVILSAVLSIACFPPFQSTEAAWCCLIPLLLCLRPGGTKQPFLTGYVFGLIFWVSTLYWLRHVTWFGWWLLAAYCALYPALFCKLLHSVWARVGHVRRRDRLLLMLTAALLWGGLEWIRSTVGSGFPWNALAVSQHERISLIQICSVGGVYLLSSLIVAFNMALAFVLLRYVESGFRGRGMMQVELLVAFGLVALATVFGLKTIQNAAPVSKRARVALIQLNVPQLDKWTSEFQTEIYRRLLHWTELVRDHHDDLDLMIWPETAVPDDVLHSEASMNLVIHLTSTGIPLLVGSMDVEWPEEGPVNYYNSTFLFGREGELLGRYDKQHLVMMGEYIPLHRYLHFLDPISPIAVSFTSGKTASVMELPSCGVAFSPLICFEDTVAPLGRKAVNAGARMLVNQTNDAWFDPSAGSRQHFYNGLFRAVENRVPLIRCCNTGVTGVIDRFGRIHRTLKTPDGELRFEGYLIDDVPVPGDEFTPTLYTRWGDLFGGGCGLLVIALGRLAWRDRRK